MSTATDVGNENAVGEAPPADLPNVDAVATATTMDMATVDEVGKPPDVAAKLVVDDSTTAHTEVAALDETEVAAPADEAAVMADAEAAAFAAGEVVQYRDPRGETVAPVSPFSSASPLNLKALARLNTARVKVFWRRWPRPATTLPSPPLSQLRTGRSLPDERPPPASGAKAYKLPDERPLPTPGAKVYKPLPPADELNRLSPISRLVALEKAGEDAFAADEVLTKSEAEVERAANRVQCPRCTRTFAADRIEMHVKVCQAKPPKTPHSARHGVSITTAAHQTPAMMPLVVEAVERNQVTPTAPSNASKVAHLAPAMVPTVVKDVKGGHATPMPSSSQPLLNGNLLTPNVVSDILASPTGRSTDSQSDFNWLTGKKTFRSVAF